MHKKWSCHNYVTIKIVLNLSNKYRLSRSNVRILCEMIKIIKCLLFVYTKSDNKAFFYSSALKIVEKVFIKSSKEIFVENLS